MKKAMLVWGLCVMAMIAGASTVEAVQPMVAAGEGHTVGLKSDGTVIAIGKNEASQLNVDNWTDITQILAASDGTVGLKTNGTVMAAGYNHFGQLNVNDWTDIIQMAAGRSRTVGLKSDGTVVAVGDNYFGQLNVDDWTDITQVAAGGGHSVGLKNDGTVVAVGNDWYGQLDVGDWTDITQVAAASAYTVGLKSDGTVVAVGRNGYYDQLNVCGWTDITQVAAGGSHTVGLKSDGTVVAVGDNSDGQLNVGDWTDITQVAAGDSNTMGLKSDGTVVAVGGNKYCQLFVEDWNLYAGSGQYGTIEGQVADASGGVEGAVVELFFIGKVDSTVTDAEGYYQFENVAEGNYRVHVIPPGPQYPDFYLAGVKLQQMSVRAETTSVADFVLRTMDMNLNGDGDIDQEDILIINYLRGEDASVCPDCDLDDDGAITGLDARKAVVQCTRPGCAVE